MMEQNKRENVLFTNIIYRLNDQDDKKSAIRKMLPWLLVCSLGLPLIIALLPEIIIGREIVIRSSLAHSLFELFFLILAFIIGYAIYHEYAISKKWRNFYLVLAFFTMGLNDFLHVLFENDAVLPDLFHFFSVFCGALFLTLCALSVKNDTRTAPRRAVLAALFGAVLALSAAIALSPLFISSSGGLAGEALNKIFAARQLSGEPSHFLIIFHTIPAVLFLIPGILFLKYFKETDDLVYYVFSLLSLLFSESELFLAFSREWSPGWWCSHLIKLAVYSGVGDRYRAPASAFLLRTAGVAGEIPEPRSGGDPFL